MIFNSIKVKNSATIDDKEVNKISFNNFCWLDLENN
jgi:hypothetical protein